MAHSLRSLSPPARLASFYFAFFAYSCQIFSLAFALPLLLTSGHGISLGSAGLLSAIVMAVSLTSRINVGLLALNFGWRLAFVIIAVLGVIWVVAWYATATDHPAPRAAGACSCPRAR